MNAVTRISVKGQVVIPKASRERWGLEPGTEVEVVETDEGVLLKPRRQDVRLSIDQARARLAEIVRYAGPPATIEEMNEAIAAAWKSGGRTVW